jgi:hypothetical protein
MYGNCKICGQMFGTLDGKTFFEECDHVKEEVLESINKRENSKMKETIKELLEVHFIVKLNTGDYCVILEGEEAWEEAHLLPEGIFCRGILEEDEVEVIYDMEGHPYQMFLDGEFEKVEPKVKVVWRRDDQ